MSKASKERITVRESRFSLIQILNIETSPDFMHVTLANEDKR